MGRRKRAGCGIHAVLQLADLSVALQDRSDRYRVTLFARNITDESLTVLKTGASGSPTTAGSARYQIPRDAERYFGVQFYLEDLLGCPVDLVTEKALRPELRPYIEREAVHV